jgi:putative AdoMet-dependent methyltransferase
MGSSTLPPWHYDESVPTGVDYRDAQRVAEYDARHGRFRSFETEARAMLADLRVGAGACIIDIGAGTGAFAVPAALSGARVYAVDVSPAMRQCLDEKARAAGATTLTVCAGGFLTYEHQGPPADAVVSVATLHHLPDLWKQIALLRVAGMLRPNGRLLLADVALGDDAWPPLPALESWVAGIGAATGAPDEAETHLRDEFSTFGWVLSGMIERAGFRLDRVATEGNLFMRWLATRRE